MTSNYEAGIKERVTEILALLSHYSDFGCDNYEDVKQAKQSILFLLDEEIRKATVNGQLDEIEYLLSLPNLNEYIVKKYCLDMQEALKLQSKSINENN